MKSFNYFNQKLFLLTFLSIISISIVNGAILTPPYFNLVANKNIYATATCGEDVEQPELFCKLTGATFSGTEMPSNVNLIQVICLYYL